MLFSSLFLPSLLSTQNIIWYLPSKKGSLVVVVGTLDEIVLYPFQKKMRQWHHKQKHGSKICVWRQQLQFSASSCHKRKWHWFDMWPKYEKANTAAWCYYCVPLHCYRCSSACHYWSVERRHMRDIYDTICISKIIHLLGKGTRRQPTP